MTHCFFGLRCNVLDKALLRSISTQFVLNRSVALIFSLILHRLGAHKVSTNMLMRLAG